MYIFYLFGTSNEKCKPNYFFGIRTPWTLASEDNWKQSHHFASKVWVWGNILLVTAILTMPNNYAGPLFIVGIIILTIIPVYYSYRLYSKE